MIVSESMIVNGHEFVKTYSDSGYMVERDGVLYSEAIDPIDSGRTYTESDTPLETDEATAEDYQAALNEMGVQV